MILVWNFSTSGIENEARHEILDVDLRLYEGRPNERVKVEEGFTKNIEANYVEDGLIKWLNEWMETRDH